MNHQKFKRTLTMLRVCIVALLFAFVSMALFSFTLSRKLSSDFWGQLGVSSQQGTQSIKNSFLNGYVEHYSMRNAKNIVAGNRAAVAKDLLEYAKKYLASQEFNKQYEKFRMSLIPGKPDTKVVDKESIRKEKIAEMEKAIVQTKDLVTKFPDMKKDAEQNIAEFNRTISDYKKPNSEMIELFYQAELGSAEQEQKYYEKSLADWEKNHPADPTKKLEQYLKKYLSISSTVDFDAVLVEKHGKKIFSNPAYERKSSDWKMIFRAGREVYDVAKPFTENWLREL